MGERCAVLKEAKILEGFRCSVLDDRSSKMARNEDVGWMVRRVIVRCDLMAV
jgi:hypothetical protein